LHKCGLSRAKEYSRAGTPECLLQVEARRAVG
jgi:hypothetical protein